jgi:DNA-binding CsgD family transcriptional regulator
MLEHERMDAHSRVDLFKGLLDSLSISIFLIETGNRLIFTNAAGDAMLSDGTYVHSVCGVSSEYRTISLPLALADAVDRVTRGICTSGIGVSLASENGKQSAAYVLPISGKKLRGTQVLVYCAILVTQRSEQQPMVIDILRMMFDLTNSEARIASLIAKGHGPHTIAKTLGITINTVRSHLQHAFSKTNSSDQTALGALVNGLIAPVA